MMGIKPLVAKGVQNTAFSKGIYYLLISYVSFGLYSCEEDERIIVCPYGIGDLVYNAELFERYYQTHGKKLVYGIPQKYEGIMQRYNKKYFIVPTKVLSLFKVIFKNLGKIKCYHNAITDYRNQYNLNRLRDKRETLLELIESNLELKNQGLPSEIVNINRQWHRDGGGEQKCIIFPEANSMTEINVEFWIDIARFLESEGFEVYFNKTRELDTRLSTYKTIDCTLDKIFDYVDEYGYLISMRSGICDLLIRSSAKKIVVYPTNEITVGEKDDYSPYDAYSFSRMGIPGFDEIEYSAENFELSLDKCKGVVKSWREEGQKI